MKYVRGLDPRLPRAVWTMEVGGFANAFGNGLAFPFLFIYLHNVRGFSLPTVGLIAGTSAAGGIASIPFAGMLVDRIGGKRTLIGALVLLSVGFAGYTLVHEPWQAFAASAIVGIGNGAFWPSQSALIIGLTPPARRHASFALQRVMRNFGVGLGGVAGGLIATTENATSYTVLFGLDAVTFLLFVVVLSFVPDPGLSREEADQPGRYREVLRNRLFLGVVGLNVVYVTAGYAMLEVFPVFAKNEAGVTERQIGFIFFANTLAIVIAQLPLSKLLEGRRRMPALALMTFVWAGAWSIVFAGGVWFQAGSAALVFGLAASSSASASASTARRRARSSPTWHLRGCEAGTWRSRRFPGRSGSSSARPRRGSSSTPRPTRSGRSRPLSACSPASVRFCSRSGSRPSFGERRNENGADAQDVVVGVGATAELRMRGAGGEPVDFRRTLASHGVADLPPNRIDEEAWTLELTLPLDGKAPRTVRVSEGRKGHAKLEVIGRAPGKADLEQLRSSVAHVLRLDEDLSPFYAAAAADPELSWATTGAGRMVRSPTVFEEVVKTVCTTNCTWSATVRMVSALVEHLGEPGESADGPFGRAFPTPEAMAKANLRFYKDVVRAGYRGQYLRSLAKSVASGKLDLEALGRASPEDVPDDELAAQLLALPGVGPYAAAHVMMLSGRYTPLILDSWTRPKYLKVSGAKRAKDATIERRFRRYGPYAGLAFWLYLTQDWLDG